MTVVRKRGGASWCGVAGLLAGHLVCGGAWAQARPVPPMRLLPEWAAAPVPDDADVASALARLQSRPARVVCPGSAGDVVTSMGTPCATREFQAPALLQAPRRQWRVQDGFWTHLPFIVVGERLYSASCRHNHLAEGGVFALDTQSGKVLWRDKTLCTLESDATGTVDFDYRLFAMPNQVLMVSVEGSNRLHLQLWLDMKTGKTVSQSKSRLNWWNVQWFGDQMVSHARASGGVGYVAARGPDLGEPRWKFDAFVGACPKGTADDLCKSHDIGRLAHADGVVLASGARRDMAAPVYRQLHALDAKAGVLLWRHTGQEVVSRDAQGDKRGDDSSPMVADGKAIVRVDGGLGTTTAFRALHLKTGQVLWTTTPVPTYFVQEWLPRATGRYAVHSQKPVSHLVAGQWLLVHVDGGEPGHAELLAYRMADGRPAWRRPLQGASQDARLGASAGGVVYIMGRFELSALEAETGTRLWTVPLKPDVEDPEALSLEGGVAAGAVLHRKGEVVWPENWMLGPDGGIYIQSPFNLTKLR
jgi:outer membrane protein assembly factor BamB